MSARMSQGGREQVPPKRWICGLDIAAESFTATVIVDGRVIDAREPFTNGQTGYADLCAWLGAQGVPCPGHQDWPGNLDEAPLILMEATGVYWEECALELHRQGFEVNVVNASRISHFGKSRLRRSKTDKIDANLIAQFGQKNDLSRWTPPDLDMESLQLIMRQREDYLSMLTEERNRLHALKRRPQVPVAVLKNTEEHIEFLKRKIKDLEGEFKDELKKFPEWQEDMKLLQTIPGVAFVTSAVILTETQGMVDYQRAGQVTAHAGLNPAQHTSGSSVQGQTRISKIGNPKLRRALFLAALTAARSQTPLGDLYRRLIAQNKPKKVALVAVARKLLALAFTLVRTGMPYDPAHVSIRPL